MLKIPEIILDIGVNYYDIAAKESISPLDAAKQMINEAKKAGADVAKFQTYKAEKLAADHSPAYWDLTEESTATQKELFAKFDHFNFEDYEKLAAYCWATGIEFMTTTFDVESAEYINPLVNKHKIASADITNIELLTRIGSFGKPVLLSTGASTKEEIETAVRLLEISGTQEITLLHCVLNYPTKPEQANLWKIRTLHKVFPTYAVGYSDHTRYNAEALVSAWLLGAEIIEKHFTLDKTIKGNDHYHSASPADIADIIKTFNLISTMFGKDKTDWYDPLEKKARFFARRGVYLVRDVMGGEVIMAEDAKFLRPQAEGVSPLYWSEVVNQGKKYRRDLKKGDLIIASDLD